jgi:Putative Flp pilus-assembly TadE/G-like
MPSAREQEVLSGGRTRCVSTASRNQAGQVLISTTLAMVVLVGFAGLAVDMGILRYQKRVQQSAADAAAIAGATDLPSNYRTGAMNAAAANGFTDNTAGGDCRVPPANLAVGSVNVGVCAPPIGGPHAGQQGYVEAYVSAGQPTFFMRILGVNKKTITARSVASNNSTGTNGAPYGCMYAIGSPGNPVQGMTLQDASIVFAPSCGIVDNGDYTSSGAITASSFGVSGANNGGEDGSVTCTSGASSCPSLNSPAAADPLAGYTPPCTPCSGGTNISITGRGNFSGAGVRYARGTYTVSPGTYHAITISARRGENVVFRPGSYVINGAGGLRVTGNANISGNDVSFYFTGRSTINVTGSPTLNLSASASGQYAGMLLWQARADTANPSLSAATGSLNGILYFPSDQLSFAANTTLNVGVVVAASVSAGGRANLKIEGAAINGGAGVPGGLPRAFTDPSAVLVE